VGKCGEKASRACRVGALLVNYHRKKGKAQRETLTNTVNIRKIGKEGDQRAERVRTLESVRDRLEANKGY